MLGRVTAAPEPKLRVAVQMNNNELWNEAFTTNEQISKTYSGNMAVQQGDRLYFRVGSGAKGAGGAALCNPMLNYTSFGSNPRLVHQIAFTFS